MNIFSTDAYLDALAEVHFPRRRTAIEHVRVGGEVFRVLSADGEPILSAPFMDFLSPLRPTSTLEARSIGYLPRGVLSTRAVTERPATFAEGALPSPYLDLSLYASVEEIRARMGKRNGDSRRSRKKLERDIGALTFTYDDPRASTFDACIAWKSAQYRQTGLTDMFAAAANVSMFHALRARGAVVVSSLAAGDALLAVHIGGLADERLYWWVPAYDPAHAKFSPGRLLLEDLVEESHRRRLREFDFLIGDEAYKWQYATHNRMVGPLGSLPLALRLQRTAKRGLKSALSLDPRILAAAVSLKRRLRG